MKIDGYDALDSACKKRWCWSPGNYQHRGACGSGGSRNTGMTTRCCLERAYRGCPDPVPEPGAPAPWDEVTPNDHINGDHADNRIANLREANQAENMQNLWRPHRDNRTGFMGVVKDGGEFIAKLKAGPYIVRSVRFPTASEAHACYLQIKASFHPFGAVVAA